MYPAYLRQESTKIVEKQEARNLPAVGRQEVRLIFTAIQ